MEITTHDNGMLSSNLGALNDKQRASIFGVHHQNDISSISVCINGIVVLEFHEYDPIILRINPVGKITYL